MHLKFSVLLLSQSNECFWSHPNLQTGHETKKIPSMLATLKAGKEESSLTSTFHSQGIHYSVGKRMTSLTSWFISLSLSSAHLSEIRAGLRDATVCHQVWFMAGFSNSLYLGDKNKLQPRKPRSCGWQFENIWKRKGFLQYTSCVDHSKHRKKKSLAILAQRDSLCCENHALFTSVPVTIRSGQMSFSYTLSIPDV